MIRSAWFGGDWSDDDVCAQCFQVARLFHRSLVRHHKDALVTFDRRGDRQTNARVAGGGFDNSASGPQLAFALCSFNHRDANAILHRKTGIEVLHLGENQRLHPFIQTIEFDEWRVPD